MHFSTIICLFYFVSLCSCQVDSQEQSFVQKWFGWFRKPNNISSTLSKDELTRADFASSLPNKSTDKLISDALSRRILEEARLNTYKENSFINTRSINRRSGLGRSISDTSNIPVVEALRIVHASNLTDCVARVICELSCNANVYGNQGRQVFRNLIKLQFDNTVKSEDTKFFRHSAARGRQLVQSKKDCNECFTIYPICHADSKDLIAVSAMFKI